MGDRGSNRPERAHTIGKGTKAVMALFLAATFGVMALLSIPLSPFATLAPRIPAPIKGALNPLEPFFPPLQGIGPGRARHEYHGLLSVGLRGLAPTVAIRPPAGPAPVPPLARKGPLPPLLPPLPRQITSGHRTVEGPLDRLQREGERASDERGRPARKRHAHAKEKPCSHERRQRHPVFHRGGKRDGIRTTATPGHPPWPDGPDRRPARPR